MIDDYRVPTVDLTMNRPDHVFTFGTTADLSPLDTIIGQRRGVEAIDFGLNMKDPGYHIFITGEEGTGKSTIIRDILSVAAQHRDTPEDLCLVNNFDDEYSPRALKMPTGSAVFFSRRMAQFIETIKVKLPKAFYDESFREKQEAVKAEFSKENQNLMSQLQEASSKLDIGIVKTEQGYQPVPLHDGQPVTQEQFQGYDPKRKAELEANLIQVDRLLNDTLKEIHSQALRMQEKLGNLASSMATDLFSEEMDMAFATFQNLPQVRKFLDRVKKDMMENISPLLNAVLQEKGKDPKAPAGTAFLETRYRVNVLVDRRGKKGAPVIFEPNPVFQNLFGKIEKRPVRDGEVTNFTMVQAGAILEADNGYLILEVESLLRNPAVWETLKSTLQNRKLYIQDPPDQAGFFMASLKPEPIPIEVKVILLGNYHIFHALQDADPKFNKIFKVRVDFDQETGLTPETLKEYARFMAGVCKSHNLLPFSSDGVWAVVEHGARMAEDKAKLSLRFGRVLDLLKEADYWAHKENALLVDDAHVTRALREYRFRHNLYEEKMQERYDDHSILLDVKGSVVGQVNALAVYRIGEINFGRPARITAEAYMGKPGIINVEHEAQLSGQTHDKGVMIIAGYLGRVFAQNYPLSVSVSVTFEQSYSGIDGDSASSTELYAVLSSLSGLPIRQSIAVTGSVNQKGQIQAIGGVNEKIEGFFDVCAKKGLTGDQGVMIPMANVKNLVLRKDVIQAVETGMFHIYRVSTIEQGIEVLTGVEAGTPDEHLNFPKGSVFGAAQAKLKKFHELSAPAR